MKLKMKLTCMITIMAVLISSMSVFAEPFGPEEAGVEEKSGIQIQVIAEGPLSEEEIERHNQEEQVNIGVSEKPPCDFDGYMTTPSEYE